MQRVHSCADHIMAGFLKSVLEANGIKCFVRFDHLVGGAGELPPTALWPEIWVVHDEDASAAKTQIERATQPPEKNAEPWQCPDCGETIEGQFSACWQCTEPGNPC